MAKPEALQESWVEVQEQQGETLSHTSSMKEMKELLASAASEEELSDSEQLYQVTFEATEDSPEDEVVSTQVFSQLSASQLKYRSHIPSVSSIPMSSRIEPRSGICSLTLLVPVIILTHLAMFGIGYYFGRRWSADASMAVMKVFHV